MCDELRILLDDNVGDGIRPQGRSFSDDELQFFLAANDGDIGKAVRMACTVTAYDWFRAGDSTAAEKWYNTAAKYVGPSNQLPRGAYYKGGRTRVNPAVLKWASERAHMSLRQVAQKIGCTPGDLRAWESNDSIEHPNIEQLRQMAYIYECQFAWFFYPAIPVDTTVEEELRTLEQNGNFPLICDRLRTLLAYQAITQAFVRHMHELSLQDNDPVQKLVGGIMSNVLGWIEEYLKKEQNG